jgi:solute carrier family 25 phosphate transporter 23/24/25/41
MWQTMVIMYKTEGGIFALYRGIIPTVAGVAPYVRFVLLGNEIITDQGSRSA